MGGSFVRRRGRALRRRALWPILAALAIAAAPGRPASGGFLAGGVYDEQTVQTNAVDRNISGNPLSSTGGTDLAGFTADVAAAYAQGLGGVVGFDSGAADGSNWFWVSYGAGGAKRFKVTSLDSTNEANLQVMTTGAVGADAVAISGERLLLAVSDLLPAGGGYPWKLQLGDFEPGEPVVRVALTLLARDNDRYDDADNHNQSVAAYFSGGGSAVSSQIKMVRGQPHDTFVALAAPAGEHITRIEIFSNSPSIKNGRPAIDDLGFIVAPEPATLGLVGAGVAAVLVGGRRRGRKSRGG